MLLWLVMQINEAMFQPISDTATRVMLQTFSFFEILIELILLAVFALMAVMGAMERRK